MNIKNIIKWMFKLIFIVVITLTIKYMIFGCEDSEPIYIESKKSDSNISTDKFKETTKNVHKIDSILMQSRVLIDTRMREIIGINWNYSTVILENGSVHPYDSIKHKFMRDSTLIKINSI